MSITDGHLFFDSNVFAQGRRPAVNIPISVTRVGKQTQDQIGKDINRELSSLFAIYERVENLSHFGSEMTESVKSIFSMGGKVYQFFNQPGNVILPKEVYLVLFALVWLNILDTESDIEETRNNLLIAYQKDENKLLLRSFLSVDSFNDLLKNIREHKEMIFNLWKPTQPTA
jgi:F-type H+-transporting ATPase subunit alpha